MDLTCCFLQDIVWPLSRAADDDLEGLSVLGTHEVVEHGVEGDREVVEEAREVHEVLIDDPVAMAVPEVHIAKSLNVKRSPRYEKQNNHGN